MHALVHHAWCFVTLTLAIWSRLEACMVCAGNHDLAVSLLRACVELSPNGNVADLETALGAQVRLLLHLFVFLAHLLMHAVGAQLLQLPTITDAVARWTPRVPDH